MLTLKVADLCRILSTNCRNPTFFRTNWQKQRLSWLKHRDHLTPTLLYYWLTNIVWIWNQPSDFLSHRRFKRSSVDVLFFKWLLFTLRLERPPPTWRPRPTAAAPLLRPTGRESSRWRTRWTSPSWKDRGGRRGRGSASGDTCRNTGSPTPTATATWRRTRVRTLIINDGGEMLMCGEERGGHVGGRDHLIININGNDSDGVILTVCTSG